jgi:hypothetical protein
MHVGPAGMQCFARRALSFRGIKLQDLAGVAASRKGLAIPRLISAPSSPARSRRGHATRERQRVPLPPLLRPSSGAEKAYLIRSHCPALHISNSLERISMKAITNLIGRRRVAPSGPEHYRALNPSQLDDVVVGAGVL